MTGAIRILAIAGLAALLLAAGATAPAWAVTSGNATYTYDALGRLTQVTYDNGTTIAYNYDSAGNRTSVVTTCSATGC